MAAATLMRKIGSAINEAAIGSRISSGWYDPHMAAASRAVVERIPLVDFVLEVRDARVPKTSEYELMKNYPPSSKRIIILNKTDLADRSQTEAWTRFFEDHNCISYGVNSHNKENIREFLTFLQARVRELKKSGHSSHATTMMLVGIPNVGKSALANSLHQIGRISAAEKGKLKNAIVSPQPGETKNISSLKIASHPNIYVLDTPGILPPKILNIEVCSKLALTGAIRDILVGEQVVVQYLLTLINSSDKYKKWGNLSATDSLLERSTCSSLEKQKRGYPSDHTQDIIVNDVRRILFETISTFDGNLEDEKGMGNLIETQLLALHKALHVPMGFDNDSPIKVASKLLNLYRTGRLGRYTIDSLPNNT
ncbi:DAR GTPase 2, mitochondrial isoform X1 [Cucurbita pepo subsp. pepo]|uniref:DAR GTPase 2, mitochondrial isoform X1 n=1 Tax=Cucurbita pepo subsp. pepo TaxID=3664 RepID=UPI000C9D6905|nr:DAR GTPase 2, mitochondrial isoform X1 [Cucurbita pepo subsp. pepo]